MLTLWKPHNELTRWNRDLENLFTWNSQGRSRFFSPAVDIQELEDSFVITADLPGVKKEDIEIQVENDTLTLSGQREGTASEEENGLYRRERASGSFKRSFSLGPQVATGDIEANYVDGVLTLKLPKAAEAKPHKIDVH